MLSFQVCQSVAGWTKVCWDPLDVSAASFAYGGEVKPNYVYVANCIRLIGQTTGKSSEKWLAVSQNPYAGVEMKVLEGGDCG